MNILCYVLHNYYIREVKIFNLNNRLFTVCLFVSSFFTFIFAPVLLFSQSLDTYYLSAERGLSNNDVHCIYQSREGYIWLGTTDGLNRYDAYGFTVYRKESKQNESLLDNRIVDITEDENGGLLIATNSGISIFHPILKTFKTFRYDPLEGKEQIMLTGRSKFLKLNEQIYIGSDNAGFLMYSGQHGRQIPLRLKGDLLVNFNVLAITSQGMRTVWMLVENIGLCRYQIGVDFIEVIDPNFKTGNALLWQGFASLSIGTDDGIYELDLQTRKSKFQKFSRPVLSLFSDSKATVWATTDGDGVYIKRTGHVNYVNEFAATGRSEVLSSSTIKQVWEDRLGRLWFGSIRGGVTILASRTSIFQAIKPNRPNNLTHDNWFISAFGEDRLGNLWVGTDGNGLFYWDRQNKSFQVYDLPKISSRNITDIVKDKSENIWVASWDGGVSRYDSDSDRFTHFRLYDPTSGNFCDNVWTLFVDSKGTLWASTFGEGGLFRWVPEKALFESVLTGVGNILTMMEDTDGTLWFGTDASVIRFNVGTKNFLTFGFDYRIRSIHRADGNKLWIGTEGGGLLSFDKHSGRYRMYNEENGLSNDNVLAIQKDDEGKLWLTTFNGLNKFDPEHSVFTVYSVSDGLQSNRFNYNASKRLSSGELVFGGTKGFNIFYPNLIKEVENENSARLSELKINGRDLGNTLNLGYLRSFKDGESLQLEIPYDQAFITGVYTAFPFFAVENLKYQTFLKGLDRDWLPLGSSRSFSYSKIPPGEYELFVRTSRRNNLWKEASVMKLVVLPPWYWTKWAISLYIVGLCGIFYFVIWFRQQKVRVNYEAKLITLEQEKEREIGEKKLHLVTDIVDELKIPLMLIINPLKSLVKSDQWKQNKDLQLMERNANRILLLTDQLVQMKSSSANILSPIIKQFNFYEVVDAAYSAFESIANQKRIKYEFECNNENLHVFGDPQKIELVLFNLFSTVFKSTNEQEHIKVQIIELENSIQLVIWSSMTSIATGVELYTDSNGDIKTGIGTGNSDLGLTLVQRFIREHKGKLFVDCENPPGASMGIELNKGDWFSDVPTDIEIVNEKYQGYSNEKLEERLLTISNRKSVLIIDDNIEFMSYLARVIAKEYIVHQAITTQEAKELITRHPIHMILTEVFLDGAGYELCRSIKEDPAKQHIPVIFTSVLGATENQLYGIEAGAEDYLVKPFDIDILLARVHAIFEGRSILQQYFFNQITLTENQIYISHTHKTFLEKCIQVIEGNLVNTDFNSKSLAVACNMSYSNLYKKVRMISGLSTSAFIRSIRLRRAAVLLLSTDLNINEVAFEVGVLDLKYFREKFKELYGMPPSIYARKYRSSFNREFNLITE